MTQQTPASFDATDVLDNLPAYRDGATGVREALLANLVMVGEIPSPTFGEERRIRFLTDRFTECGLSNCSTDEMGNGFGVYPGKSGKKTIVVTAHADTAFDETVDHTITLLPDRVVGPGIGDNSLGVAALATLPTLIEALGVEFDCDLLLMGASQSLNRGNMAGLRFFLDHTELDLAAGLCVEGVQLGRLSHESIGMVRCEINISVPETYDWSRFGTESAIPALTQVINLIHEIRLPRSPRTSIMMGRISGGTAISHVATNASLRLEIRSESSDIVRELEEELRAIIGECSSRTGATIELDVYARRNPGGIEFSHSLVRASKAILEALELQPRSGPSISELSAFIYRELPALTIGLTRGTNLNDLDEELEIAPMFTGMAQLLALIEVIDRGCRDED